MAVCEVRKVGPGNVDDLLALLEQFTREVLPEKDSGHVRDCYREFLGREGFDRCMTGFVLYLEGKPVGCAQLFSYPHPPMLDTEEFRQAEVMNVYVVPTQRRKGYGQLLMSRLLEEAAALKVRHLRLNSSPDAERLYEKNGFKQPTFKSYMRWLKV